MTALLPIGSTKGTPIKEPQTVSHRGNLNMLQIFAYWTDCAIATYEVAGLRKGTSKADLRRFRSIALEMLVDLQQFNASTLNPTTEKDKEEYKRVQERFTKSEETHNSRLNSSSQAE